MNEITGAQLYHAFAAGGMAVIAEREDLNRMNVYPVPDGDTGSNLSFTLKQIIEQTTISPHAGATMKSLAASALSGAKGNSGILFAQFVNGMADSIGEISKISTVAFCDAVSHAASTAYRAISDPVEGTMLTIMRTFADSLKELTHKAEDYKTLFKTSMKSVQKSLKATKETLEVLRKANVIDAGAKGFVTFLEGFQEFLLSGHDPAELSLESKPEIVFEGKSEHHNEIEAEEDLTFRFCTEGYISGENLDLEMIRKSLSSFGDSLIVAGGAQNVRIHIHSDHPDKVFAILRDHGEIQEEKADDMHRQYQMVHDRKAETALVVDSTCGLPEAFLDKHQIYQVPLMVNIGDVQYLDGLTLKPGRFYKMMKTLKDPILTSQPNVQTFSKLFDHLTSHYTSVISLSLSAAQSGTHNSASQAAKGFKGVHISTVDSRENGAGLGLMAAAAAEDIEAGKSQEEIINNIISKKDRTETFVIAPTLKYLVRGGRVSRVKGLIGRMLNLKAVIGLDKNGKAYNRDKAYSMKQVYAQVLQTVREIHEKNEVESYAILHADALEDSQLLAAEIHKITGVKVKYIDLLTPVLGAHGGPGTINLAVLTKN